MTTPGWYPDGQGAQRYWDGRQWTSATEPMPPTAQAQRPPATTPPSGPPSHRTRNIILGIVGVLVIFGVIGAIAGGGSKNKPSGSGSTPVVIQTSSTPVAPSTSAMVAITTPTPSTSAPSSVSNGLGGSDASGDVKLGKLKPAGEFSLASVPLTVTNHSSKRSDYIITVALETADGKTQLDTGDGFIQNLEPGQSSTQTVSFLQAPDNLPRGAKVVLQEVERTVSL